MSISGLTNTFSNPNPKIFNSLSISNSKSFNGDCKFKFRVYAKVTTPEPNARVYGQFSAPVKPSSSSTTSSSSSSSSKTKEDEERKDYYLNMGYAIRCLREEFPELFYKEPNFDIYRAGDLASKVHAQVLPGRRHIPQVQGAAIWTRGPARSSQVNQGHPHSLSRDDIVFKDPLNTFSGIENYKTIFWVLRFHGKIFFKALWIEILSVWQPMENVILVRWTVHGIPRVPWESRGRFDAISEYKLDRNGKVYAHKVDNIALNSPGKFQILSVQELILSLGCPSPPKPTCFEFSPPTKLIPLLGKMKSVIHYLNSALEFSHRHDTETSQGS